MKKLIIIALSLVLVAGIALTVFIKVYVTPDKVKEYVIPIAEQTLNRKISIGEIDINIFKGIGLKDFTIKEPDQKTDFIKCENFVLKFQLLPLLSRKVIIDKLNVVSPSVRVERGKDGKYNFDDILKKDASLKQPEGTKKQSDQSMPISLLVSRILISNAQLSMSDLMKENPDVRGSADIDISMKSSDSFTLFTEGSVNIKLDEIVLRKPSEKHLRDLSSTLNYAVHLDTNSYDVLIDRADITVQAITASVQGSVSKLKTSPEVDITVKIPKVKTAEIQELAALFVDMKEINLSGALDGNVKLKGKVNNLDDLIINSALSFDNVGVAHKEIDSHLKGNLKLALNSGNLQIDTENLVLDNVPLSLKGDINNVRTSPALNIALSLPKAETAKLQSLLAPFLKVEGLNLTGHLAADLKVKGLVKKPDELNANGNISMEKLGIKYNNINALIDGKIEITGQKAQINLTGSSGNNSANITGTVNNLFKNQDINLNAYSKRLILDEFIPEASKKPSSQSASKKPAEAKEPEPLNLKLRAKGEVKIDSAIYKNMHMTDFYMNYLFKDNKLTISTMTANAGKGKFALNSLVDFSTPGYAYNLAATIDSLNTAELVNSFVPAAAGKVFGTITSNLKLDGRGTLPAAIRRNLSADGDFNIRDGKISDAEIAKGLSLFINLKELETIEFTKAEGAVKIRNGMARLDSVFKSKDIAMDPKGNIGLDETLDLAFDLKLSPHLTGKAVTSKVGKYLKDEGEWGTIPVLIKGTFTNPAYEADISRVGKQVIEKKVNKLIDKMFKKDTTEVPPGEVQEKEGSTEKAVNPLEDMLKKLPGKLF